MLRTTRRRRGHALARQRGVSDFVRGCVSGASHSCDLAVATSAPIPPVCRPHSTTSSPSCDARDVGHVDHRQVHAHAHRSTGARRPRTSTAARFDSARGRSRPRSRSAATAITLGRRRHERLPVAHGKLRRHALELHDARHQAHRRAQAARGAQRRARADAVERDPRPDHREMRVGAATASPRCWRCAPSAGAHRAAASASHGPVEALAAGSRSSLVRRRCRRWQKCEKTPFDRRSRRRAAARRAAPAAPPAARRVRPMPVSTLMCTPSGRRARDRSAPAQLTHHLAMQDGHRQRDVAAARRHRPRSPPVEHQDRCCARRRAQLDALLDRRHAEPVGAGRSQDRRHQRRAVAVRVGLHHRAESHGGDGTAARSCGEVVAQSARRRWRRRLDVQLDGVVSWWNGESASYQTCPRL